MGMESRQDVMQFLLNYMAERTSQTVINAWFSDADMIQLTEDKAVIRTTAEFKRDILRTRFTEPAMEALKELFGVPMGIEYIAEGDTAARDTREEKASYFHENYTFRNFVIGKSNRLAASAAMAVAEHPGVKYNPLLIYGASGLGKTHLLYAMLNQLRTHRPELTVLEFSAESFTNELTMAIRTNTTQNFREKYRTADVILVDDIQFIGGKDYSQEEFFHTFNTLYQLSGQIVVTSDRPPKDMPLLEERLRSRFDAGLIADIQPPDFETRKAIVEAAAARMGMQLTDPVVNYIADSVTSNIRQLEGAVKKMLAYRDMRGQVSLEDAQKTISEIMRTHPGMRPTPEYVLKKVCEYYKADMQDVLGSSRRANLVIVRQVGMYIIRLMTDVSLQRVGDFFKRDHSTVMHSVEKIGRDRTSDPSLDTQITQIIENIRTDE